MQKAMFIRFAVAAFVMATVMVAADQPTISAGDAQQHIGEQARVCGVVASTRFSARTRGEPTFLNLDKPYPDQVFTILIWGENRAKFGAPENRYLHKRICASGLIKEYRGTPEIIASDPSQINVQP